MPYLSTPASGLSVPVNAGDAAIVGLFDRLISLVFRSRTLSKVFDAIVRLVAIDVIYLARRPATICERPDHDVGEIRSTCDVAVKIPAGVPAI